MAMVSRREERVISISRSTWARPSTLGESSISGRTVPRSIWMAVAPSAVSENENPFARMGAIRAAYLRKSARGESAIGGGLYRNWRGAHGIDTRRRRSNVALVKVRRASEAGSGTAIALAGADAGGVIL